METQRRDIYSRLINLWRLEEYLLHSYHSIFLAFNSVLIAIGAFLFSRVGTAAPSGSAGGGVDTARLGNAIPATALAVLGFISCLIWSLLFKDRAHAASFFPTAMEVLDREPGAAARYENTYTAFKEYRQGAGTSPLWKTELSRHDSRTRASWPRCTLSLLPFLLMAYWLIFLIALWILAFHR